MLRTDRDRYERACVRRLERFAAEAPNASLADLQVNRGRLRPDQRGYNARLRPHLDPARQVIEPASKTSHCPTGPPARSLYPRRT